MQNIQFTGKCSVETNFWKTFNKLKLLGQKCLNIRHKKKINSWKYIDKNVKIVKTEIREIFLMKHNYSKSSLVALMVKSPPELQETSVRFLCWEDPLDEGKATHSSILAWRIQNPHGQRSLADYNPWGCKECDITEWLCTKQHKKYSYWLRSE